MKAGAMPISAGNPDAAPLSERSAPAMFRTLLLFPGHLK
jgi:hypothetical protein